MHKKSNKQSMHLVFLWCEESSTEHELPVRVSYCHFFYRGEKTFTPKTRKTQRDRFCDNMRKFIFVHVFQFTGSNIYTSFTQNIYVYWLNIDEMQRIENCYLYWMPMGHFRRQKNVCYSKPPKTFQICLWYCDIMARHYETLLSVCHGCLVYCHSLLWLLCVRRRDMTINTGMSMIRHLSGIKPSKCKRGQIKETQRFVRDKNGIRTSSARRWCHMFNYKRLWWHLAPVHAEFTEGLLE